MFYIIACVLLVKSGVSKSKRKYILVIMGGLVKDKSEHMFYNII
jgi:hypothetical protein